MSGHDDPILGTPGLAEGEETGTDEDGEKHRMSRGRRVLIGIVLVVVAAIVAASLISIPYYAITPGNTQSVLQMIGVPSGHNHDHKGDVLMVDVQLVPLKAIEWLWFKLDPNAQIVPNADLIGNQSAAQYNVEGELDMSNAQQAATVVALRHLGYHVSVKPNGALVYALVPGSPAEASLEVGDRVTAVDGKPVHTALDFAKSLAGRTPGSYVNLAYASFPSHDASKARIRLSAWRIKGTGKNRTLICPLYGTDTRYPIDHISTLTGKPVSSTACLGLEGIETSFAIGSLPFKVDLHSEGIIGPSAGLAFTLGLMQHLDPYDLTGGHKVAATGTMSINGKIGPIGGIAQKTVAVRDSGAKAFFVPAANYKVAKAHAGSGLAVYSVNNINQVLNILVHRYGGKLPPASPHASTAQQLTG